MIPKTKHGDCDFCPNKNTSVIKRGKDYYCLNCAKRQSVKKQIDKAKDKETVGIKSVSSNAELTRWFNDRHKEMTGRCKHCGGRTQKGQSNYKCSIAHILPKAYFKSVATHDSNWIELCFYGKSCHSNLDAGMIDLIELNCWDEVITKFVKMYPDIATQERRRIPEVLLQYVETEK